MTPTPRPLPSLLIVPVAIASAPLRMSVRDLLSFPAPTHHDDLRACDLLARFPPGLLLRGLLDALTESLHVLAEAAAGGASRQEYRHEAAEHDAGPHEVHSTLHLFHPYTPLRSKVQT